MASNRSSIKLETNQRQKLWREKFRSQCVERVKGTRKEQIDQRRHNSWMNNVIAQEWQQFRQQYEQELQQAGTEIYTDLEAMIEESIQIENNRQEEDQYEEYQRLQQEELDMVIEEYESIKTSICMKCQQPNFAQQYDQGLCSHCGYVVKNEVLNTIYQTKQNHDSSCTDKMEFMVEPGENGNILGLCGSCDLWILF
ncbi:uncharacterized protein BX664DRAFT_340036 [Halteromyces radiatus]|uniref:uncharacterized protein n=1 Tax=Halteromyces radiatus TaxID=101107 RepID=UPI00221F5784|nr:uncharacterized protein BX664DRAFT_340036 [Halteromyces radiatus]KAI8081282.1 hypothetical protein BX664DRAFT_340036 [Halteromyces radiatus]